MARVEGGCDARSRRANAVTIDAHQHFWSLARGDYDWLTAAPGALRRDFLPGDLQPEHDAAGVVGSVLVQAAPTLAETRFLLGIAARLSCVLAVVGWIDVRSADAVRQLRVFARDPNFRGIRPMLQEFADIAWLLDDAVQPVMRALIEHDLSFDALIRADQMTTIATLAAAYPELRIIVDHGAKPPVASGRIADWAAALARLAEQSGVSCKMSGLISEAAPGAPIDIVAPYAEAIMASFGANRVMWGSDWPMLVTHTTMTAWHDWCRALVTPYGAAAVRDVFGQTAARVYRLAEVKE